MLDIMSHVSFFSPLEKFTSTKKSFVVFFLLIIIFFGIPKYARAATVTWDGGGSDGTCGGGVGDGNKWSCGANWSTNSIPTSSDVATFDGTSTKSATIDSSINVLGIDINTGYSGTITQSATATIGSSGYAQDSGVFLGGSQAMDINDGSFTLNAGSFQSTSGTLSIERNFTVVGSSFIHNSGTVTFDGANGTDDGTITCSGSEAFTKVTFNKTFSSSTLTIGSSCILPLGNSPTSSFGILTNNGSVTAGTGTWTITLGDYIQSSVGASTTFTGTTIDTAGSWEITAGTFTAGSLTTLNVEHDLDNSGNKLPTGLNLTLDGTASSDSGTITCSGSEAFTKVTFNKTFSSSTLTIGSSCILPLGNSPTSSFGILTNNGSVTAGTGTWTITLGDYIQSSVGASTTFTGTTIDTAGSWEITAGTFTAGSLTTLNVEHDLDNSGNKLPTGLNLTLDGTASSDSGTITCSGSEAWGSITINKTSSTGETTLECTATVTGNFTRTDGPVLNSGSARTLSVQGNMVIDTTDAFGGSNLTMSLTGGSNQSLTRNAASTFSSPLTINKSGNTASLTTSFTTTTANCTVVEGNFNLAGYSLTCGGTFTIEDGGTLQLVGSETPTTPTLNSGSTVKYVGDGDTASDSYTLANYSYSNLTINATDGTTDTFTINNNFSLASLTLTAGTIAKGAGASTLSSSGLVTVNGASITTGALSITASAGLTCSSGTLNASSATVAITGALTISGCAMTAPGSTMTVTGNFAHSSGSFTANGGTVSLTGTSQSVSGTTTFYNLSKVVTSADTLTFGAGATQTITNTTTLTGASGNLLTLASSSPGTQWIIDPQGSRSISYVSVSYSNNINDTQITVAGNNITDGGNNTGWLFNQDPTAPTSLAPTAMVDGSFGASNQPSLTFSLADPDAGNTVQYRVQIDDSSDFSSVVADYTSALAAQGSFSFTVGQVAGSGSYTTGTSGQTLADGSYYWRVKTIDNSSASSSYSTANSGAIAFKVDTTSPSGPSSVASSDHSTSTYNSDNTVTITWTAATDAASGVSGYSYIFDTTANTIPNTSQDIGMVTTITSSAVSDGNAHYFHIRVIDNVGNVGTTVHSGPYYIDTTAPSVPGTPSTTTPTNDTTLTWSWTASSDVTSGLAATPYTLQWSQSSSFSSSVSSTTATTNSFTHVTPLTDGYWYFRVKATDLAGNESSNSSHGSAQINTGAPTGTINISSGAGYTNTRSVTLTLSASSGFFSNTADIQMKISNLPDLSDGSYEAFSSSKLWTLTTSDGTKTVYVQFKDTTGNESGAYTDTIVLDTTAPNNFELQSPEENSYTNNDRPTFKWKAASTPDESSGIAKYKLLVDNGDSGDFVVDNISPSRTTSYETTQYKIEYENFNDSDTTNNSISLYTKSSLLWGLNQDDGKLKEGERNWEVIAIDNVGNERSIGRTLFVDLTKPNAKIVQLNDRKISSNNLATSDRTPTVFGLVTDTLSGNSSSELEEIRKNNRTVSGPKSILMRLEKQNSLGAYDIHTIATISLGEVFWSKDESIVSNISEHSSNVSSRFEFTPIAHLENGLYRINFQGKDGAGNIGDETILYLSIDSFQKIGTKSQVANKKKLIDKAIEAEIPKSGKGVRDHIRDSLLKETEVTNEKTPQNLSLVDTVKTEVTQSISDSKKSMNNLGSFFQIVSENTKNGLKESVKKPQILITNIGSWLKHTRTSFSEIVLDSEPTKITDVSVSELTPTTAVIIWKTNHQATSKVNYGRTKDYGKDIQVNEKVRNHRLKITGLEPGVTYNYEVMSQGKNYVYDANHEFVTPKVDAE